MSGYRTLHREKEQQANPIWTASISPCNQSRSKQLGSSASSDQQHPSPLRVLTSSADGLIRAYSIVDKSSSSNDNNGKTDVLDASALKVEQTQILLPSSQMKFNPSATNKDNNKEDASSSSSSFALGSSVISIIRNYVAEDVKAGSEVAASLRLDGYISIWLREEQKVYTNNTNSKQQQKGNEQKSVTVVKPDQEFHIPHAAGTTMSLLSPQNTGYINEGLLILVGCLDGSIELLGTGIAIANPKVVADTKKTKEPTSPGAVLDKIGAGNAIPTALTLHPTQPYSFVVGRKNGIVDMYSCRTKDHSNIPLFGQFRRTHRLTNQTGSCIRAIAYTPDGSLLITGCDDGHLYIHDTSSNNKKNQTIRLVATILNAHKGYILSIDILPDSRRFVTSGSDKTVKVWNAATPNNGPVHTFTGHEGMVWDVVCSLDGRRCVSSGDDGLLQVYSCDE